MADLRALIEKNLSFTLEGDFGMRVNLIGPDGIRDTTAVDGRPLKGQVLHSITRDGEQMNGLIGRVTVDVPVVTLRRSSLRRVPFPGENWIVEIPDSPRPGAPMIQYALSSTRTPEGGKSIGTIRLYLQYVEQVLAVYSDDLASTGAVCEADFITPVFADDLATGSALDAAALQGPPPTDLPDYALTSDSTLGTAEATGVLPADDLLGAVGDLDSSNPEGIGAVSANSLTSLSTLDAADLAPIGALLASDATGTSTLDAASLTNVPPLVGADLASSGTATTGELAGVIAGADLAGSSSTDTASAVGGLGAADLSGASTLDAGNGAVALPAADLASSGTVAAGPWAPVSTITFIVAGDLAANDLAGSGTIAAGAWAPTASIAFTNFVDPTPVSTIQFSNFGE